MRGTPNNPIICMGCGEKTAWGDGLCNPCRFKGRRKYNWTPALDDDLRRIYTDNAGSRIRLSEALRSFQKRVGWPRGTILIRAMHLTITVIKRNPWTKEHDLLLRDMAGNRSMDFMAKVLHRSFASIRSRITVFKLSRRCAEGYSRNDLIQVFGVSQVTTRKWIALGWLSPKPSTDRIPEAQVMRFITAHPEEYSLKRVDEAWFKGMMFPNFGINAHDRRDRTDITGVEHHA
jgi:hypothetical protein